MTNIDENGASLPSIIGRDPVFIDKKSLERPVHKALVGPVQSLKAIASASGFDLRIASAYRSFDQQLSIWNSKARGLKPVLDTQENPIDLNELSPIERVFAILRWTALPGASRHHWGSDFDIYDASALADGQMLELTQAETAEGGVFEAFYLWLNKFLDDTVSDFFRPYSVDRGGVAPEPWHLSYRPISSPIEKKMDIDFLLAALKDTDIAYRTEVMENIEEIYFRFVLNVEK